MAVFQTAPWRAISGILGAMCLLLVATLGILLKDCKFLKTLKQNIQPTVSPGLTMEPQKDSDCYSCPEKWIGYHCNCYLISNTEKTWAESRDFCASQNSKLLHLKSKDELSFGKHSQRFYWLGLTYNETRHIWLWEDGSTLSQDLFSSSQELNPEKCILHDPRGTTLNEPCGKKNHYICQQQSSKFS
ncbi:natural killer cells antigen CD94 [Echinops telfairi]|uniref:Natural killer cells antigen CD94 n=1 Tax=Echinops telfairi TaxID=9371 RepID=A0AC55DBU0_ECHTE|nr:natural killer cells antigen CD94 [Echinops telfairi]